MDKRNSLRGYQNISSSDQQKKGKSCYFCLKRDESIITVQKFYFLFTPHKCSVDLFDLLIIRISCYIVGRVNWPPTVPSDIFGPRKENDFVLIWNFVNCIYYLEPLWHIRENGADFFREIVFEFKTWTEFPDEAIFE